MAVLVHNKRATFEYELLDSLDAGLQLQGWEVKSLRNGRGSLAESFITIRSGEALILNMHIGRWPGMRINDPKVETQERKLLLHRQELDRLQKGISIKGNTIIPINVHTSGKTIKMKIALARGKKLYDKRESLKKKDLERQIKQDLL